MSLFDISSLVFITIIAINAIIYVMRSKEKKMAMLGDKLVMVKRIIIVLYGILFFSMRDTIVSYKNPFLTVTFAIVGGLGIALITNMFDKYHESKENMRKIQSHK